jgi:hypothetical protein
MAISNHATEEERDAEVERVWREFWLPIVGRPDGSIDMEQVKKELHDLHMLHEHCGLAYDWMTGGKVSKANTEFETVKAIAEDLRTKEIDEAVKEESEHWRHAASTTPLE